MTTPIISMNQTNHDTTLEPFQSKNWMVDSSKLLPYQLEGSSFLISKQRAILADKPGFGKSLQTLHAISMFPKKLDNILIICPKIAFGVWFDQIAQWVNHDDNETTGRNIIVTIAASGQSSKFIPEPQDNSIYVVITNPASVHHVQKLSTIFDLLIIDEAHIYRNRRTTMFKRLHDLINNRLIGNCPKFLLTGSPVVNRGDDMWTLLNILHPQRFKSYWAFVGKYFDTVQTPFGTDVLGIKNRPQFREFLAEFMIRRTEDDVPSQLPKKTRQRISVRLHPKTRALYNSIEKEFLVELSRFDDSSNSDDILSIQGVLARFVRLRQLTISPQLIGEKLSTGTESPTLSAMNDLTSLSFDAQNPVVIFTPFAQAIPLIVKNLQGICEEFYSFDGSSNIHVRQKALQGFRSSQNPKRVLICTTRVGLSFTATEASTVIFVGSDVTPAQNIQCEDRVHRIGQKMPVNVYYIVAEDTIDYRILDILNHKMTWVEVIKQRHQQSSEAKGS